MTQPSQRGPIAASAGDQYAHPDVSVPALVETNAVATLEDAYRRLQASQLATLNLMEDAIESKAHLERSNRDLQQQILERERMERALHDSQQRLQAILDHSPAMIFVKDPEGRYVVTNRRFNDRYVKPGQSAIGRTVFDLQPKSVADAHRAHDREALVSGAPVQREIVEEAGDGRSIYLSTKFPLRDANGAIYAVCGIATDITERKSLESQFLQAQKMEAFGQLAGGVAHDFNNILAVFLMQLNLLQLEPNMPPSTISALKGLEHLASRAANLTRQLLIFSRRQEVERRPLELSRAVDSVCRLLRHILGEHIALEFEPPKAPLWIEADAGMIEQVVMNLCVNARDAMPRGGRLTIAFGSEQRQPPAGLEGAEPRQYAMLSVSDTGIGMDESTQRRVFEPFFTTKPVGQGTGLGLATVYGIAQQHRGWVEVDSKLGIGSTFRVYFPLTSDTASESGEASPAPAGGTERILLVEDEELVRVSTAVCLRKAGYDVIEAKHGPEARQQWCDAAKRIDLLLTDMVMPEGVTGAQLADELTKEHPGLKVVLMSGYHAGMGASNSPLAAAECRLMKPFTMAKLLETVRQVLDTP